MMGKSDINEQAILCSVLCHFRMDVEGIFSRETQSYVALALPV